MPVSTEIGKYYSKLLNLNQRLKTISEAYYISTSGVVFMKSAVPYIEKIGVLTDDFPINLFGGAMILPNKLFEFTKLAKKTKLICDITKDSIYYGQDDNLDLSIKINRLCNIEAEGGKDSEFLKNHESSLITRTIQPEMYVRLPNIYPTFNDENKYYPLSLDEVNDVVSGKIIDFTGGEIKFRIARDLFASMKKTDSLAMKKLSYINPDNSLKEYILFKEECPTITIYTVTAQVNFGIE